MASDDFQQDDEAKMQGDEARRRDEQSLKISRQTYILAIVSLTFIVCRRLISCAILLATHTYVC